MFGLGFLGGFALGALIMSVPALTAALWVDTNNVHYKAGYKDGYKNGKQEGMVNDGN